MTFAFSHVFILLKDSTKDKIVHKIGYIFNYKLFDVLHFFILHINTVKLRYLLTDVDEDDLFIFLTLFFTRYLQIRSENVKFNFNGEIVEDGKEIYNQFLGVVVSKSFSSQFSVKFVEQLIL